MDDRELRASLQRLPEVRPRADFTAEVLARVGRGVRRRAGAAGGGGDARGFAPRWRGTLLAAGLAAGLVAAVGLWRPEGSWWTGGPATNGAVGGASGERLDERGDGRSGLSAEGGAPQGGRQGSADGVGRPGGDRVQRRESAGDADDRGATGGADVSPVSGALATRAGRAGSTAHGSRGADAGSGTSPAGAAVTALPDGGEHRVLDRSVPDAADSVPLAEHGSAAVPANAAADPAPPAHGGRLAQRESGPFPSPLAEGVSAAVATSSGEPLVEAGRLATADRAEFFAAPPAEPAAALLAERLADLAAERERLAVRLAEFRRKVPPAEPPVVLLGAGEGLELVFDVGRFAAGHGPAAEVRPAAHSNADPPRR